MQLKQILVLCAQLLVLPAVICGQSTEDVLLRRSDTVGTVYFIMPLPYKAEPHGKAEADFTFYYHRKQKNLDFTLNLTYEDKGLKGIPDSLKLGTQKNMVKADSLSLLFVEHHRRKWENRISAKMEPARAKKLLDQPHFIYLFYGKEKVILEPRRKTLKRLDIGIETIEIELQD